MTTPPARLPWLWILTHDHHLLRADQIIAIEASTRAVNALVAVPDIESSPVSNGAIYSEPTRFTLARAEDQDDAKRIAAKLLQFVGEHLAAGRAGVVAWDDKELELTQWPQA